MDWPGPEFDNIDLSEWIAIQELPQYEAEKERREYARPSKKRRILGESDDTPPDR